MIERKIERLLVAMKNVDRPAAIIASRDIADDLSYGGTLPILSKFALSWASDEKEDVVAAKGKANPAKSDPEPVAEIEKAAEPDTGADTTAEDEQKKAAPKKRGRPKGSKKKPNPKVSAVG